MVVFFMSDVQVVEDEEHEMSIIMVPVRESGFQKMIFKYLVFQQVLHRRRVEELLKILRNFTSRFVQI